MDPGKQRENTMLKSNSGVTLIELMLALAVAAVIMSVSMPSLHDLMQRQRISAAANELVASLNLARQNAVFQREITLMCPSTNGAICSGDNRWDHGWIVFRDPDRNRTPEAATDILRIAGRVKGINMDSAGRTLVRYRPSGFASGTNLTIKLCDGTDSANSRAVIVSNSGRPRTGDLPNHLTCANSGG